MKIIDKNCSVAIQLACVASVTVRFSRKERGTRVKDRKKSGPLSLFGSRFISRAVKTESPLRYFFARKPNGNACYAGYNPVRDGLFKVPNNGLPGRWLDKPGYTRLG